MTDAPYTIGTKNTEKIRILSEAQNWRCAYCGCLCHGSGTSWFAPSRDHVIPVCVGGPSEWSNEVMACNLCNNGRGAMYARRYFQMVQWKGRWKAFKWGVRVRTRDSAQAKLTRLRSESHAPSPLAAIGSELGSPQVAGAGCENAIA